MLSVVTIVGAAGAVVVFGAVRLLGYGHFDRARMRRQRRERRKK